MKIFLLVCLILVLVFINACGDRGTKDNNIVIKDSDRDTNNVNVGSNDNKDDNENEVVGSNDSKDDEAVVETFLDENNVVTNVESIEVVVNKQRNLDEKYVPEDLVTLTDVPTCLANPEVNQLKKEAADALTDLFEKAKEELDIQLYARSGYRSYNTQVSLYNGYVTNHGQEAADTFSAKPGQSEHQTGLAMDITSETVNLQLTEDFGDTDEGKWINENSYKYGFIVRYPKGKESITGYMYEPWHIRYIGKELAKKVYESELTLDEYLFGE
ncbi:M15 family metallopeptidase [Sedimentibacter sp. zth1]|uniref:M15 family metallopeptidase n=1 Tax=Sedimentibacter sp. zth1 TaxID=2816908 RepID=UPI001A915591|nr:M15 family metallopeptidase [Sedimentibacter sp. zth1]QSX07011.1 M15 family metallopeptidase [Sedimentibacter sp. zth1]